MFRKMIASFTAVASALLVVGVAWASNDSSPSGSVGIDASAEGSVEATGEAGDDSPSTSLGTSTSSTTTSESPSTSTGDETTTTSLGDTTSTTVETTSTTSSSSSTSTSVGESADPEDSRNTYTIPAVGTVTIEVRAGVLILVDVSAPGWNVDLEKVENDRVRIEFTAGLAEAEFEARIEGRSVDIDIEVESD